MQETASTEHYDPELPRLNPKSVTMVSFADETSIEARVGLTPERLRLEDDLGRADAEIVVSSKGHYVYECFCGATTFGSLEKVDLSDPFLKCLNYESCGARINALPLAGKGPRHALVWKNDRVIREGNEYNLQWYLFSRGVTKRQPH